MALTLASTTVSIADEGIDFKGAEQLCWEAGKHLARCLMERWLQQREETVFAAHDRHQLRVKDRRPRRVLTVMGDVRFVRRRYRDREAKRDRYLLDEAIGLRPGVGLAGQVADLGMWLATQGSYGQASRLLTTLVGERIPKQSIWQLVQRRGAALVAQATQTRQAVFDTGQIPPAPATVLPVLFGEADGCMIAVQRAKGTRAEVKVGVWYEGWKQQPVTREEYALVGKQYVATLAAAQAFWEDMSLVAETRYGRSAIPEVYVGGDGARWITTGAQVLGPTRVKLDTFHLHRLLGRTFGWTPATTTVVQQFLAGAWDAPVQTLTALAVNEPNEKRRTKQAAALAFLDRHRALLPHVCYAAPVQGALVNRQLGTMERHVDLVVAERFKKRGMSWSLRGAEHLLQLRLQGLNGTWACPLAEPVARPAQREPVPRRARRVRARAIPAATVPVVVGPHQGRPWVKWLKATLHIPTIGVA